MMEEFSQLNWIPNIYKKEREGLKKLPGELWKGVSNA